MSALLAAQEFRTRVVCNLPTKRQREDPLYGSYKKTLKTILWYVQSQEKYLIGVNGYTVSVPGGNWGRWCSSDLASTVPVIDRDPGNVDSNAEPGTRLRSPKWHRDDIIILTVDFALRLDSDAMRMKQSELRAEILSAYRAYGVAQEEVWVVAHEVIRQRHVSPQLHPVPTPQG